ncbi:polyketide synthase dehydratase-domain-containing protein [Xylariaceae sp. FL0804]|nr:polyketide synthase dehydratase-domain-containing protein [Xylariaceae sp. FL0804]
MISSVTGNKLDNSDLPISYWCDNRRNRVRFDTALQHLGTDEGFYDINVVVEIGPHAALGGPIKQIIAANGLDTQHVPSLMRGKDSSVALLKAAGELCNRGLNIDFEFVNSLETASSAVATKSKNATPRYLPDLPPYQWNYSEQHWYQPRPMAELRESKHPRHDILGRKFFGLSANAATWKNMLRQRDVAWIADHTLGTDVVFPAAGHISLAVEALLQQLDLEPSEAGGVQFRDIDIQKALIVPDNDDGIEVHAAGIKVQIPCSDMAHESRYMLHPATIDGCLHAVIASVHRGLHKEMLWGVIPLEIEEMTTASPRPKVTWLPKASALLGRRKPGTATSPATSSSLATLGSA